jgi:hypothetical protein
MRIAMLKSVTYVKAYIKKTLLLESASELYRLSDRSSPAKLVPTFAHRGCHVVSVIEKAYIYIYRYRFAYLIIHHTMEN